MSGKCYPEEFKIEAVKQIVDRGYSISSVAIRLDITTHSLYVWIKKYVRILLLIKNSQMLRLRSAGSRKS
ncbi:ISEc14 transposase A [Klebsiella pneumoniae]|nr:ISEc14 transposase A [Klebsiella pneumoniae]